MSDEVKPSHHYNLKNNKYFPSLKCDLWVFQLDSFHISVHFYVFFCLTQVKELQKQTGVRIKVKTSEETTENSEAIIAIEESFASGQVSHSFAILLPQTGST